MCWTADSEDIDVKDIDQILRDLEEKYLKDLRLPTSHQSGLA